ncbi:MAG: 4-oxalocrotonate tautomerase [Candidatus Omnitrophica bacterium CG1_02_49_10]|nr:MAG: 4-oxalocrotonate tautomerase [Candidatus Omnitrophica bacterium CG1_02_49_10]
MPVIKVDWWEGRTKKQKAALAKKVTDAVVEVTGCPPEVVHIVYTDVKKSDWAIGGKLSE